jgi:DNA modification methylase
MEKTPEEFVSNLVDVFREVKRVLRDDGTLWLNLGDSYCGTGNKGDSKDPKHPEGRSGQRIALNNKINGLKPKDLVGIPWRVAFALQADGWYLRQDIIWNKPNPMPESVQDRCTKAHEYIFLLSKSSKYHYDCDAIKEDSQVGRDWKKTGGNLLGVGTHKRGGSMVELKGRPHGIVRSRELKYNSKENILRGNVIGGSDTTEDMMEKTGDTRNKRSVWTVNTQPFKGAHFAVFPPDLIRPCIKAGCPDGGIVLDPFGGSGTTGLVAEQEGKNAVLIELNEEYVDLSRKRTSQSSLFSNT